MTRRSLSLTVALFAAAPALATETLDWDTIGRIRDEGFRRSGKHAVAAHCLQRASGFHERPGMQHVGRTAQRMGGVEVPGRRPQSFPSKEGST